MTCSRDTACALAPPKLLCVQGVTGDSQLDEEDVFSDAIAFFQHSECNASNPVRVNQPSIDTGG